MEDLFGYLSNEIKEPLFKITPSNTLKYVISLIIIINYIVTCKVSLSNLFLFYVLMFIIVISLYICIIVGKKYIINNIGKNALYLIDYIFNYAFNIILLYFIVSPFLPKDFILYPILTKYLNSIVLLVLIYISVYTIEFILYNNIDNLPYFIEIDDLDIYNILLCNKGDIILLHNDKYYVYQLDSSNCSFKRVFNHYEDAERFIEARPYVDKVIQKNKEKKLFKIDNNAYIDANDIKAKMQDNTF